MSQQPTSHLCSKGNSLGDLRTLLLDFENTWYIIREVFLVHFFYDMLGKSISPTGWSVQCQLMCLIHAGFRDGVATAVKRLICLKIKCSRKITVRAQTSQSKIWKSCTLSFLDPQAERLTQLLWWPQAGAWSPSPMAAAPTGMPRDGAVPILDRVVGWAQGFQRGSIAPGPQGALTPKVCSVLYVSFSAFFSCF